MEKTVPAGVRAEDAGRMRLYQLKEMMMLSKKRLKKEVISVMLKAVAKLEQYSMEANETKSPEAAINLVHMINHLKQDHIKIKAKASLPPLAINSEGTILPDRMKEIDPVDIRLEAAPASLQGLTNIFYQGDCIGYFMRSLRSGFTWGVTNTEEEGMANTEKEAILFVFRAHFGWDVDVTIPDPASDVDARFGDRKRLIVDPNDIRVEQYHGTVSFVYYQNIYAGTIRHDDAMERWEMNAPLSEGPVYNEDYNASLEYLIEYSMNKRGENVRWG